MPNNWRVDDCCCGERWGSLARAQHDGIERLLVAAPRARQEAKACVSGGPVRSEGPSMCTVTEVTLHDHAQHCPCMLDRSAVKVAALSALVPTVEAKEKAIATAITLQLSLSP
jgi:hypothetical protein